MTGPCYIYISYGQRGGGNAVNQLIQAGTNVGVGGGAAAPASTAQFLGTAEVAPVLEIQEQIEPLYNDLAGAVPYDLSYLGEQAVVTADLTRWNHSVHNLISKRAKASGNQPGTDGLLDRGSLFMTEGIAFTLFLQFPYASKPAMQAAGMPAGLRFPFTVLKGPDIHSPLGTRAKKLHVVFHSLGLFDVKTGKFVLYDNQVQGLPPIN